MVHHLCGNCGAWAFAAGIFLIGGTQAMAQLPAPGGYVEAESTTVGHLALSGLAKQNLQKQLENSVFQIFVRQPEAHFLAGSGAGFDGAVVAVHPEVVKDVVSTTDIVEKEVEPEEENPSSFFGRGLDKASSPFYVEAEPEKAIESTKQFYLTTADWMTRANAYEIDVFGKKVKANLEYRDESQNVAILSTVSMPQVKGVKLYDAEAVMPSTVFVLLNPNSMYESLTQHSLSVAQVHRYGAANLTARNGYPLFNAKGELVGLCVGPGTSRTQSMVVHPGVLDRALHPKKYDRTTIENVDVIEY